MNKTKKIKDMIKSGELKDKLILGERVTKIYAAMLLASFVIVVLWVVIFKCNNNEALHIQENLEKTLWERFTYRLEPFVDLRYLIRSGEWLNLETLAFLFNVICFMPLGMLLSFFVRDRWCVLYLFLFSVGIEVFQLFSGFGGFDPSDMILNTLGAYFGCLLIKPLRRNVPEKTVNAIMLGCCLPMCIWAIVCVILTIINYPVY